MYVQHLFLNQTGVKYEPLLFFRSSATRVSSHVRSLRSKLRCFTNLALTLMSARMKGARARARSYTSRRDSEKKRTAYISNVQLS